MIAYLKGQILYKTTNSLIINVHDIGYEVFVSINLLSDYNIGHEIEIFTYHNVKEDAQELYGFRSEDELELFKKLISVSGVGPKTGLAFFSVSASSDIENAIASEDVTFITRIPGIGKKTAERIVLELKNKIGVSASLGEAPATSANNEVIEALTGLGYNAQEARQALANIPKDIELAEDKIKEALKGLNRL